MHNSNSRSKANPSGLESLNGQEETRTEEKHMNSTGTNGEGGFEEAVEAKDWRFDAFVSSDELITCGDQEGMGARSGEGGLGMESQERNIVTADVIPLAALPHLRGKAEPQLPQTTQATDLEEIIIENVEVQHQVAESRRKRSKSNGVAKDESILRNERAKKLLLEQKKIADGSGYMAEKAQSWLAEHRRKGRERALRSRKKQKAKAAARGLLQLHGSDDEGEDGGVRKDRGTKDGEKTEMNATKGSEGGKTAVDGGDDKSSSPNENGQPLVWDKSNGIVTQKL